MSIETVLRFAELGLSAPILQAIDEIGYETPSPIQARSIPPLVAGRDLLGQAQTGTGKTAAFALPMLGQMDPSSRATQALVLTPTRELAIQVAEAIHSYAKHLSGLTVLPIYGGQHIGAQLRPLQRGVQVVVGTPGRVLDHLSRKTLKLNAVKMVVLDEADEMLRMGFIDDVDAILAATPAERQVALFSATMPRAIRSIADRHLKNPELVTIRSATSTVESIRQRALIVPWRQKLDALTRILETNEFDAMLVFARTKVATVELAEKLEARGHAVSPLNGDMNQAMRERTVARLRDGSLDIVVATDVAARGLDVPRISHVVNYDIPTDTEAYVHRIGRTGRAGRDGEAILLVQPREKRMLRSIERATRQPIEAMHLPSSADVTERRVARFKETVKETIEQEDLTFFGEILASMREEQDISTDTIAAALAFLVQQERPLQSPPDEQEQRFQSRFGEGRDDRRGRRDEDDAPRPRHRATGPANDDWEPYRIEVGRRHGTEPKHIVGAIANETGLDGRSIGRIEVHDDHCIVDLPPGMPTPILRHLQDVEIFGHPLMARPLRGGSNGHGNGAGLRPSGGRVRAEPTAVATRGRVPARAPAVSSPAA